MSKKLTREQEKAMFAKKEAGKSYKKSYSGPSNDITHIRNKAMEMTDSELRAFGAAPKGSKIYYDEYGGYFYVVWPAGKEIHALTWDASEEYIWAHGQNRWIEIEQRDL